MSTKIHPTYIPMLIMLTPSQYQVEVDPTSIICSKCFHQKNVNKNCFTECPGEGSQEEEVQQGCHDLAGILVKGREENATLIETFR